MPLCIPKFIDLHPNWNLLNKLEFKCTKWPKWKFWFFFPKLFSGEIWIKLVKNQNVLCSDQSLEAFCSSTCLIYYLRYKFVILGQKQKMTWDLSTFMSFQVIGTLKFLPTLIAVFVFFTFFSAVLTKPQFIIVFTFE